jgi:hypothetical protein
MKKEDNMKTKKLSRKLTFTKQTIANLEAREQNGVRGGTQNTLVICEPTWLATECVKSCGGSCPICASGLPSCGLTADSIHICAC